MHAILHVRSGSCNRTSARSFFADFARLFTVCATCDTIVAAPCTSSPPLKPNSDYLTVRFNRKEITEFANYKVFGAVIWANQGSHEVVTLITASCVCIGETFPGDSRV